MLELLNWIFLGFSSIFVMFAIFFCVCWKKRKNYALSSDKIGTSNLPTNTSIVEANNKQNYFLHDVQYLSINNSEEFSPSCNIKSNEHFSYNILSIFRNIQNNKFSEIPEDMSRILPDNLEDSHTDAMHENFDKSVLRLQNETPESNSRLNERDETYSCISSDSKGTFVSVPFYNRSYSIGETFKSTISEN